MGNGRKKNDPTLARVLGAHDNKSCINKTLIDMLHATINEVCTVKCCWYIPQQQILTGQADVSVLLVVGVLHHSV